MPVKRLVTASSCWSPVRDLMDSSGMLELPVVSRQAVYDLLARLLVDHARTSSSRSGAPMTAKYVAQCSGSIAAVVDSAFPGYLRSGLLPSIAGRPLVVDDEGDAG